MRFQFMLVPVAIVAAAPVAATDFLTVAQAQALLFPGATFTSQDITLTEDQIDAIEHLSATVVLHPHVKLWRASTGGWFFLDQVPGRDDRVTYALALDANGAVKGIEILVCREGYCGIRSAEWRARFVGKSLTKAADLADTADLASERHLISGSTLTTQHVTEGVRRLMTTYALFVAHKAIA